MSYTAIPRTIELLSTNTKQKINISSFRIKLMIIHLFETFEMVDPEEVANQRRRLIAKLEGPQRKEYFIADYWGSEMTKDTPITERYFRIREYIKSRNPGDYGQEWLNDSISNVWSSKFIGLAEDGFQKLEFQNPPYVAASRLGGDPRNYNDTFVIQTNGCDYECSFCFVDRELNKPELGKGKYFSAKEMFDIFLKKRTEWLEQGKHLNVIRLSGGEIACLVPELILDVFNEIEKRDLSNEVYLWVDCNLSTLTYLQNLKSELSEIAKKKNFGIVGCLKTAGDGQSGRDDFAKITKAEPKYFPRQFEVLNFLVNTIKADAYVYLVPIIWGERETWQERLYECAQRLSQINRNLPLRTNVIRIRKYAPVERNIRTAHKEGRSLPKYDDANFEEWYQNIFVQDQRMITRIWYEETMPKLFTPIELEKYRYSYRCQVPLYE